jgi:hypothetical protein
VNGNRPNARCGFHAAYAIPIADADTADFVSGPARMSVWTR